jgi:hypothetical protein
MIVIAGLLLAVNAMAEEKPKDLSVTKELDKSSASLMSTGSTDDSTEATRAKENFDRSKPHAASPRDAASGLPTGKRQHRAAPADGGDYNGTRSNRSSGIVHRDVATRNCAAANTDGVDDDCDGAATRAQDYNSSRSNTTSLRLDDDSDGDSLEEVRCSMRSDECVDAGDNDPVVRKKPGRR